MGRVRMAVLFGGTSEEHAVSVKSAQQVAKSLDLDRYEPFYVGITTRGDWKLCDGPDPDWESGSCSPAVVSPDRRTHGLLVQTRNHYREVPVDLAFPVLHGKHGEDGAIQGLLHLSSLPYVGCDIQSSALCMDKSLTYLVARHAGIPTPRFRTVAPGADVDAQGLTYPVFVKPARSGSSFALSHGFFRIHQEQRPEAGSQNATFIVPADISPASRELVQRTARTLYQALGCKGLARVDLFLLEDGTVVLNEINTMPGLTSYSRFPRMMAAAGLSLADVIDRIVALALSEA
jgi:D-alanine---(R)-lactate ligase